MTKGLLLLLLIFATLTVARQIFIILESLVSVDPNMILYGLVLTGSLFSG